MDNEIKYALLQVDEIEDVEAKGLFFRLRSLLTATIRPEVDIIASQKEWEKIKRLDLIKRFINQATK